MVCKREIIVEGQIKGMNAQQNLIQNSLNFLIVFIDLWDDFHQAEILIGVGRSTRALFVILNKGGTRRRSHISPWSFNCSFIKHPYLVNYILLLRYYREPFFINNFLLIFSIKKLNAIPPFREIWCKTKNIHMCFTSKSYGWIKILIFPLFQIDSTSC